MTTWSSKLRLASAARPNLCDGIVSRVLNVTYNERGAAEARSRDGAAMSMMEANGGVGTEINCTGGQGAATLALALDGRGI